MSQKTRTAPESPGRDAATDLPAPPTSLAMVVKAAGDPEVSMQQLASLIGREPSLTTTFLRMANSAAYGGGQPVRTIRQATVRLGTRCIRNIAVSYAVRTTLSGADPGELDANRFWEDSLRRGVAALVLARRAGYEDPSEAFTLGLVQDLGLLVMAVRWRDRSAELQETTDLPGPERMASERRLTGTDHPEVFVAAAREWGLPEDMVAVAGLHHDEEATLPERRSHRLLEICRAADALADVVQTSGERGAFARVRTLLAGLQSREELTLEALVEEVREEMEVASEDLDIRIGRQPTFQDLMSNANETLIQLTDTYEELTRKLEKALRDKEEMARRLEEKNEALRRLAATDMLTGVYNRRAFTQSLQLALDTASECRRPLSLVMMDVDHFKRVNDTWGHAVGDDVLKEVCRRLEGMLRPGDVVGRLGGEEFGLLLPGCGRGEGRRVAERLREAIADRPVRGRQDAELDVTASFGGVTVQRFPAPSPDQILVQSDRALYLSKDRGRNKVTWRRLP
ncbi:MAG: sensor domain-containing diguanylate cyclase [Myxococcota bacterium]